MKKLILATLALLLVCAVVPAMAGEKSNSLEPATFQALSNLSTPGQVALNAMTDDQLAAVEGQRRIKINVARVRQTNVQVNNLCAACFASQNQSNTAFIYQSN